MERARKEVVVSELKSLLSEASSCIAMDFSGVQMTTFTPFRKECAKNHVKLVVVKNTFARIAVKDTPFEGMTKMFRGMTSLVLTMGKDQVTGAKLVKQFAEKDKKIILKGGMVDRKLLSVEEVKMLADLPSKEELYAKLLGTMNAVPTTFVRVLAAVPQTFLRLLVAYQEKKEKVN